MEHYGTSNPNVDDGSIEATGYRCLFIPPQLVSAVTASAISTAPNSIDLGPQAIFQLQALSSPPSNDSDADKSNFGSLTSEDRRKQELLEISTQLARAAEDDAIPATAPSAGRYRKVYDLQFCKDPSAFPGVLARSEGDPPTSDAAVNSLFDSIGVVYEFFATAFNDTNIFRSYSPPVGIVHYDFYFPGAFFHLPFPDPSPDSSSSSSSPSPKNNHTAIICGDGWDNDPWNHGASLKTFGGLFGNFASSLEVVAHEMVHGFLHAVCKLKLDGQPGVVNEHLADVFGIMCEQFHKNQTVAEADWLVGEDLIAPDWKGVSFRSFKAPGTAYKLSKEPFNVRDGDDAQVAHMSNYYKGKEDYGGVHINSGILNKAFYLVATRLAEKFPGEEKYKYSWNVAGKVWYTALTAELSMTRMPADCDVAGWAQRTYSAAKRKLKLDKKVLEIVREAWNDVGIVLDE